MDAIQQLLSGLQKIPTAIAGGPVDPVIQAIIRHIAESKATK
jgi:hypothetical protein